MHGDDVRQGFGGAVTPTAERWFCLNAEQVATARALCEAIVPGSVAVGPEVYLDSVAADMAAEDRAEFLGALDAAGRLLGSGRGWDDVAREPYFRLLRALAIEAYYSDFRRPGYNGPGGWDAIDYKSAPWAARAKEDWSFLRCFGGES